MMMEWHWKEDERWWNTEKDEERRQVLLVDMLTTLGLLTTSLSSLVTGHSYVSVKRFFFKFIASNYDTVSFIGF